MPEKGTNPFDDVSDDDQPTQQQKRPPQPEEDAPVQDPTPAPEATVETEGETAANAENPSDKPIAAIDNESEESDGRPIEKSVPGFDWDDSTQTPMYLKEDTEKDIDDFKYDVEGHLRRAYDVRNVETRELDTALLRAVLEHLSPEQVAAIIIEERGYAP